MKTFIFCMCFVIIVSVTEKAKSAITCSLKDDTTSAFSGYSIPDSQFSFFEYLTSDYDFDIPAMFAQVKPISGPVWNEDVSALLFLQDGNDDVAFKPFHSSGASSQRNPYLLGNVWFSAEAIERQNLKYAENGIPSNPGTSFLMSDPGKHADVEYDVIDIVPTPGAIILGSMGLGMIGWLRRYRTL